MTLNDRGNHDGSGCRSEVLFNEPSNFDDSGDSHTFGLPGRQVLLNGITREVGEAESCQCRKEGIGSSLEPEIILQGASTGLAPLLMMNIDDTITTATKSSLDEDFQSQPSAGHTTERNECSEMVVGDTTDVRKHETVQAFSNTGNATQVHTTQVGECQAQQIRRIPNPLFEREVSNPESLPFEIPTGVPVTSACTTETDTRKHQNDVPVATTSLVPAVSQSAKTAFTTHSAATELHGNLSPGTVGADSPSVPCQLDTSTPFPNHIVETWERALAATLATSRYSSALPVETLSSGWRSANATTASSLQLPPSRLFGVMCRSNDAIHTESFLVHPRWDDPGLSYGFEQPYRPVKAWFLRRTNSDVEDHKPSLSQSGSIHEKQLKKCGRCALFALIVSLVTVVTLVGAVFASRAPTSPSNGIAPSGSCNSKDGTTLALPLTVNDIKDANTTDNTIVQEWLSSWDKGSDFGEFVAFSEDGSVVAITERIRGGSSAVYVLPADLTSRAVENTSLVSVQAAITSLSLSRDGRLLAVGLSNGMAEVYSQDALCRYQWSRMGKSIRQQGMASLRQLSTQDNHTTSVSISGDGTVVAVGLVTSSNAAYYQVLRFSNGEWRPKGPTIEYGDDGSFAHSSARVSLSSNCTSASTAPCILAISRMFSYEQFSFGMISVREIGRDERSWDAVGQAIPFAMEEAKVKLASNGTKLSVSDAGSTTVYSLSDDGSRVEWVQLGQNVMPKASDFAFDESGELLALSKNYTIFVYDLQLVANSSNGSAAAADWSERHQIPIQTFGEEFAATGSQTRLAMGPHGNRLVVGQPYFLSASDQSIGPRGRVLLVGF